jgi:Outer membrane protein beta-barrel domain
MKKIIFISLFIFLVRHSNAQVRVGITGGATISTNSFKSETFSTRNYDFIYYYPPDNAFTDNANTFSKGEIHSRFSYNLGLVADFQIARSIVLRSQLLIANMGWVEKVNSTGTYAGSAQFPAGRKDSVSENDKFLLTYLQLPLLVIFKAPLRTFQLFFGAGGYIGYGLTGHYSVNILSTSIPEITDSIVEISFKDGNKYRAAKYHANSIDYGLMVTAGAEFRNNMFVELNYAIGLNNVLTDRYGIFGVKGELNGISSDPVFSNKNRSFNINLGYFFK